MKRKALALIILASAVFGLAGCSELAGSGELVSIPSVTFTCSSSNCTGAAPNSEYRVIYSSFGCQGSGSGSFNAVAINTNNNLSCSGASCSGSASSWIDSHGYALAQLPAGTYSICVVLFRHGSITNGPNSQDAYAEVDSITVDKNSASSANNVTNFVNGAAPLTLY